MNDFTTIYRILKAFQSAMDAEAFDETMISCERLKISENRRTRLLIQLVENRFISGVKVKKYVDENLPTVRIGSDATITLKGLEYLEDNSLMKKAANIIKEVKEMAPGL